MVTGRGEIGRARAGEQWWLEVAAGVLAHRRVCRVKLADVVGRFGSARPAFGGEAWAAIFPFDKADAGRTMLNPVLPDSPRAPPVGGNGSVAGADILLL